MPTFQPPHVFDIPPVLPRPQPNGQYVDPIANRLRRHYGGQPRGRTVLKSTLGVYTTVDTPSTADIEASAAHYLGGHVYEVDTDEMLALTAAGYEPTDPSVYSDTYVDVY